MDEYNKIPSQEVWNVENINSTIRQIEYYKETRIFANHQDIVELYDSLEKMIEHIEKQAEAGFKFAATAAGDKRPVARAVYKLYINEFILGDNTICVMLNDTKVVYLNHTVLNWIMTRDTKFIEYTHQHCQNIIRRSSLISDVGEKERKRFFNAMREKIERRREAAANY